MAVIGHSFPKVRSEDPDITKGGFNIRRTRQATKGKKSGKHRTVLIVDTLYYRITTKFKRRQFGILQFLSFQFLLVHSSPKNLFLASLTRPAQGPVGCKAGLLGTSTTRLS